MKGYLALVLILPLLVSAGGCSAGPPDTALVSSNVARAAADPAAATEAALAINAFGFDVYRLLVDGEEDADLVLSPASIAIALAMARAGARGETAAQMDAVLHGLGTDEGLAALNALDQALATRSGSFTARDGEQVTLSLHVANAPFAQRDYPWEQAYLDILAESFGGGLWLVDYANDAEDARQQINSWVDDKTEQRIPELLAPGLLDEMTRLVLVNAIYLKAPWLFQFVPEATRPGPFTLLDGSTVEVALMALSEELPYAEGDGWRAVELPYVGGSLAMTIIVPDDLRAFERSLEADSFARITDALAMRQVRLAMPRFEAETKAEMTRLLATIGMPLAFDASRADFSGMTAEDLLYIAAVVHQANISVDEKGTEAAAATAVIMARTSAPSDVVEMRIDRPFIFALRDVPTGAILFAGRIVDPSNG